MRRPVKLSCLIENFGLRATCFHSAVRLGRLRIYHIITSPLSTFFGTEKGSWMVRLVVAYLASRQKLCMYYVP